MTDTEIVDRLRRRAERGSPWGATAVFRSAQNESTLDESALVDRGAHPAPGRDLRGFRYAAVVILVSALAGGVFAVRDGRDGGRLETATPGSVPPVAVDELVGHTFAGTSITEDGVPRPPNAQPMSLKFTPTEVTVSGGCNYTEGTYAIVDGALHVELSGLSTVMGCAPDSLDGWFGQFVTSRPAIELADHRLLLTGGTTVVALDQEPEMAPVVGPVWHLRSAENGDPNEPIVLPTDPVPTLHLAPDGRWTVTGLCITFHGTYERHGNGRDERGVNELVDFFPTDRGYASDRCGAGDEDRRQVDRRLQATFNTARYLYPWTVVAPAPTGNDLVVRNIGTGGDVWHFRS